MIRIYVIDRASGRSLLAGRCSSEAEARRLVDLNASVFRNWYQARRGGQVLAEAGR